MIKHLPLTWLSAIGRCAALIAYVFVGKARRAVLDNLEIVAPDLDAGQRRAVARQAFTHAALSYIELLGWTRLTPEQIQAAYPVQGWEHIDRARQAGKGIIVVSAHIGTSLVGPQLLVLHGIPTTVAVEMVHPRALYDYTMKLRSQTGMTLVPTGPQAIRDIMRALRSNEAVGLLCDQDLAGTGQTLPFFGQPTQVTTAPSTLALRCGAAVIPAVVYRRGLFSGVAQVCPPLELERTESPDHDIRLATEHIVASLEGFIRKHPEQWVVFRRLWPSTMPRSNQTRLDAGLTGRGAEDQP